jgi:hypothetical protein
MDGELKYIHVVWIPAIPAGMSGFLTLVYNDEPEAWELKTSSNGYTKPAM